ncbi:hypothetical protein HMI56_005834 [Coelomomyces lativittatus]|nr:hypothetical protein HMI56_005834 [Coelomomyces lativittatus]
MKNNPNLSSLEVLERIQELYSKTKGKKVANSIRKPEGGPNHSYLSGGSETFMFNVAEHIARSNDTRTPALHCQIPSAMLKQNTGNEVWFITST